MFSKLNEKNNLKQNFLPCFLQFLEIHCPRLALVDNGNTKCSHLYEFESECVTTCAVGYRRVGAEKIVCTRNKSWNPAEMPLCGK